jgi:hypothetical protein
MNKRGLIYSLLFTRDDDLDLLQLMFLVVIVYFLVAFGLVGAGMWRVSTAAWATFGSVFATLAIAGTPKWIAELIAKSKVPGEVAQGIATSGAEPDLWKDDERGDFPEREPWR